ncbi:hypothetical protein B0H10DRAFT_1959697 [Mycena sp. CBHHK59/15]|nr:hypothetical protein B0H10DRAFT_1959697 [Mycena sp. CBHHK59/15]
MQVVWAAICGNGLGSEGDCYIIVPEGFRERFGEEKKERKKLRNGSRGTIWGSKENSYVIVPERFRERFGGGNKNNDLGAEIEKYGEMHRGIIKIRVVYRRKATNAGFRAIYMVPEHPPREIGRPESNFFCGCLKGGEGGDLLKIVPGGGTSDLEILKKIQKSEKNAVELCNRFQNQRLDNTSIIVSRYWPRALEIN